MDRIAENSLNPFEWAKKEFSGDPTYWKDRAQHGNGLIKQIADFVLLHAQAAQGEQR